MQRLLPEPVLPVEVKEDSAATAAGKAVMGALTGIFGGGAAATSAAPTAATPAAAAPATTTSAK